MGDEIQRRHFDAEDFRRFRRNLDAETHLVADLFERSELSGRGDMVGFELEAWIVNAEGHPHPENERLLGIVDNPLVVPELAAFNVELNGSPSALQGNVFSRNPRRNCRQRGRSAATAPRNLAADSRPSASCRPSGRSFLIPRTCRPWSATKR